MQEVSSNRNNTKPFLKVAATLYHERKKMENQKTNNSDSNSHMFLTGAILCANLDYSGLFDYALKAIIGGAIWMAFKLGTDYLANKIKRK